jgi:hypothetical protein
MGRERKDANLSVIELTNLVLLLKDDREYEDRDSPRHQNPQLESGVGDQGHRVVTAMTALSRISTDVFLAQAGQFRPLLVTFHRLKAAVDDPLYCPGLLFIDIDTGLIFSKIKSNIYGPQHMISPLLMKRHGGIYNHC